MPIPADGLVPEVATIVVLRCNALGDLLMALPALTALHETYPDAGITLLGAPWHAAFLRGRPGPVHRVTVLPRVPGLAGQPADVPPAAELPAVLAEVRATQPDIAVQLHGGGAVSNPLVARLGARVTAGLRAEGAAPLDRTVRYRYYQPEEVRYLEVVGLLGAAPSAAAPPFALSAAEQAAADRLLAGLPRPVVALHTGATDPRRRWPLDRFGQLARELRRNAALVAVGGGADAPAGAALTEAVPGLRDLTGQTDPGTLAAVLSRCAVVIGNDSGPLHLGRTVGAATVGLYWCGNAINAAPSERARHRPLLSWRVHCPECGVDCTPAGNPYRPGDGCDHRPSFLDQIPVAEVLAEARDLLAAADPGRTAG